MSARSRARGIVVASFVAAIAAPGARAALLEYRYAPGLIHDTATNLTYLKDANYAVTSGYLPAGGYAQSTPGVMSFEQATSFADTLIYETGGVVYDSWRLPAAAPPVPGANAFREGELGNLADQGVRSGSPAPFLNLQPQDYWTGTPYATDPVDRAYTFAFEDPYLEHYHNPRAGDQPFSLPHVLPVFEGAPERGNEPDGNAIASAFVQGWQGADNPAPDVGERTARQQVDRSGGGNQGIYDAQASAFVDVDDRLRASARVSGSGQLPLTQPLEARAVARQSSLWSVTGPASGTLVDVDAVLHLDGRLTTPSSSDPEDAFASVRISLSVTDPGARSFPVYSASASSDGSGAIITDPGSDWIRGPHDADALSIAIDLPDILSVLPDAEAFMLTLDLVTTAVFPWNHPVGSAVVGSRFDNTAFFTLSSSTPGVSFTRIGGTPQALPAPAALPLLLTALLAGAAASRRRRE